jgi:hypothetical protein
LARITAETVTMVQRNSGAISYSKESAFIISMDQ